MKEYELVSKLIYDVLASKITVSEALAKFPKNNKDINIKCAFDALVYMEADEEYRAKIKGYAQVQDEYLAQIADILAKGENLPRNVIERYMKYNKDNLISGKEKNFKGFINYIKRMINF